MSLLNQPTQCTQSYQPFLLNKKKSHKEQREQQRKGDNNELDGTLGILSQSEMI